MSFSIEEENWKLPATFLSLIHLVLTIEKILKDIRTMKKIILYIIPVLAVALVSCEPEEIPFRSQADVFMITKTIENNNQIDTLYGFALHVFANKPMTNVSVSPENATDIAYSLVAVEENPYNYYYQTEDNNFSQQLPNIGKYDFNILAETGESESKTDNLLEDFIYPTDTINYEYDTEKKQHVLSWNKIDDASYIIIQLYNTDNELVFNSPNSIDGKKTSYTLSTSSGWLGSRTPETGEKFILELDAYSFEPGQEGVNLQAKSISKDTIVWTE
ncbi:hypothetical protein [uncultured Sunxiuqinia sp.]|uniref:hypothetical protein n=1 Tax=uncultured Sunxiuqinia sp. TaxID=1573825 RepID=UPI002AA7082A|nr:hypothetical protein [uncultured Sunxiuqinia sp.]